jgi:hypothetical protein
MGHAEIVASTAATDRRYAIVEDGVLSVGTGRGAVNVRFGRRWPRDFSIIRSRRTPGVAPGLLLPASRWSWCTRTPCVGASPPVEEIEFLDATEGGCEKRDCEPMRQRGAVSAAEGGRGGASARNRPCWLRGERPS